MLHKFIAALPLLSLAFLVAAGPLDLREAAPGIIEDLLTGILNIVQQLIKDVLSGVKSGINDEISAKPLVCLTTLDPCCPCELPACPSIHGANIISSGYDVSAELTKQFTGPDGQCNDNARAAIRFGFHDAGAWDKDSTFGGADGSLMMDYGEENRAENNGLQGVRTLLRTVQSTYKVGYADLAQYAHNHATITCPKGPRVRTFIGRKDATQANPTDKLPDVHDSADNLIALFQRKGFSAHDLAALVGAHAAAKQRFVDPSAAGMPLDTTPGVWDVEFYNDTLNNQGGKNEKVFVLPSDKVLSTHPKVSDEWNAFVGDQPHWNEDYAKAYVRMSLLGVQNLKDLRECTKTLPKKKSL
ncbi:ligninase LG6 precursor [Massarina eburnea CBS 473.64]|uniref:Peroxidase n=1 Tax=Massarina eburnea CBS 473.64 TaxID=1395130 RepID=A0A6A6S3Q8_9PLEO|nr:ligninase LG6 precursor [Massarina eburnea CBS 473.64]